MRYRLLVHFVNLMLAALLAGGSFGIGLGFGREMPFDAFSLAEQQHLTQTMNMLAYAGFVTTIATCAAAWCHQHDRRARNMLVAAVPFLVLGALLSLLGQKPVNGLLHISQTIAGLCALCLIAWAGLRKGRDVLVVTL